MGGFDTAASGQPHELERTVPVAATNDPIDIDGLPRLDAADFLPLDPVYRVVRTLLAVSMAIAVALGTAVVSIITSSIAVLVTGGSLTLLIGLIGVVQRIEFRYLGYLARERDVSFRSGVISRSVATVPFARVQHVSIARGPIDRRFGLAALQLRTAGGHVAIPGLDDAVAERLKSFVGERAASLADAEVDGDDR